MNFLRQNQEKLTIFIVKLKVMFNFSVPLQKQFVIASISQTSEELEGTTLTIILLDFIPLLPVLSADF